MDKLLTLLKQNARLSDEQLATMLGTTKKEVADKIAKYEADGIIKGYAAILDDELADKDSVSAFIEIKVTPKPNVGFSELAQTIMAYDEVESVYLMSGGFDLAVIVSGNNLREIALFVAQRLSALDGVLSTATHFVLKRYKDNGICLTQTEIDERSQTSW